MSVYASDFNIKNFYLNVSILFYLNFSILVCLIL